MKHQIGDLVIGNQRTPRTVYSLVVDAHQGYTMVWIYYPDGYLFGPSELESQVTELTNIFREWT